MDTLKEESLDWALTHILKHDDTDVFPLPFEFGAIKHSWNLVKTHLLGVNLETLCAQTPSRKLIPKPKGGFRIVHQMDPLNAIIYAAIIHESGALLESARIPKEREIACSYRLNIRPDGALFDDENGYPIFHERSEKLANSGDYSHVAVADITDFYNQISQHRVENALEQAGIEEFRAKNIEHFLSSISAKQSRGLPVGPRPSIAFAEMCLNDVDTFLMRRGFTFVRYVDDFRIFCKSYPQAVNVLHDLTEYLYTSHRLNLNSAKTKIFTKKKFIENELSYPERTEHQRLQLKIWMAQIGPYGEMIDVEPEHHTLDLENMRELFEECVKTRPINLGLSRHILRRARSIRTNILAKTVIENLETLAPVFRDVSRYLSLQHCISANHREEYGSELLRFLETSVFGQLPFTRMWGLETLTLNPTLDPLRKAYSLASDSRSTLGLRPLALLHRRDGSVDWVREQKELWTNFGPWEKRAIIWSSSILPRDERKSWLKLVAETGDILDKATAHFAAESTQSKRSDKHSS